ncbi:hypothetical protein TAO_1104 [Candidatus Nitrosoglobus terrae]|uniref:UspA domain-containing protein n=1 Tax=Candidatus Nitrosoglobus terrae TaxID=1630141 RepID=A0A1Q2SMW6_9GAMM|nr:universal stress protein [Candidatus Nitrosoglobus terrae]BAW80474.1 hypothetical protein TAO_1104 [Candidatus Nitrosoglobus terrae]
MGIEFDNIIVPVDGSESSQRAAGFAANLSMDYPNHEDSNIDRIKKKYLERFSIKSIKLSTIIKKILMKKPLLAIQQRKLSFI